MMDPAKLGRVVEAMDKRDLSGLLIYSRGTTFVLRPSYLHYFSGTRPVGVAATVAGAGPAGLAAALALEHAGLTVTLIAPDPPPGTREDTRTTALFGGTVELLRHLGVWASLEPLSAPLVGLRIIDDTGSVLRAPETLFRAKEVGLAAFGYNIENSDLNRVENPRKRHRDNHFERGIQLLGGSL